MTRLSKFIALAPAERRVVREALVSVAVMRLATWTMPFARVRAIADRMRSKSLRGEFEKPPRERIAWAVNAAGNVVPAGANCLVRALAAEVMLGRYGYPAELHFGVANPAAGGFKAHAWLESEGVVVMGDFELESYVQLARTDPGAR
jgi:hypothetical protein